MKSGSLETLKHGHSFGQDRQHAGERRTFIVAVLTAVMMAVEVFFGAMTGSMALLADGLHMASHTFALGINLFAYDYARRHAHDASFSFGTGKVNSLGGFTGAVLLGVFAAIMAWESVHRMFNPIAIGFNEAMGVAAAGLLVNAVSAVILSRSHEHSHEHSHHHDHNLRSAYLHVAADALTSVLAIIALFCAKYLGLSWMDPLMGIVGAALVTRWSLGLLKVTSGVLLDREPSERLKSRIREAIENDGESRVSDLHVWAIGPHTYAAIIAIAAARVRGPQEYKGRIPSDWGVAHLTVEVNLLPLKPS